MSMKKNGAVIAVITLLLCVAVYLNWSYSREQPVDVVELNDAITGTQAVSDAQRFEEHQWQLDGEADAQTQTQVTLSEYFAKARLDRQQSRDEAMSLLQSTIDNEQSTQQARADAQAAVAVLAARTVSESRIESLVVAKGFAECVAIMDDDTISIVVQPRQAGLIGTDVAKIKDIVLAETSYSADRIRVVEAT